MSETRVPAIPTPTDSNLREVARAIKGVLDVREGLVGDPLDSAVKFRDLVGAGVVQVSLQRRGGGAAGLVVVPAAPDSGYDPSKDLTPPPAPQGFSATGLFAAVQLSWQLPAIENYAYTEIWRASTNALGSAVRIATTPASLYSDFIGNSATRYYWVRFVTQADVVGPYNATEGTPATTSQDPAFLLGLLTGQITESQLYEDLGARINLIDGSGTGSVNARIAAEAFARGQAIAAEALLRLGADQSLQTQIDLLASGTSGDLSQLISTVNTETAARIAADLSESDARALADTTLNTALDAEETARSISDDALSAATAALGASVGGVSAAIRQEADIREGVDSASAAQTLALQAQASGAAGALLVEQEVRALADTAAATQIVTLAARVDLGDAQSAAGLVIEQQARADADGALSGQVVSLAASAGDGRAALRVEQEVRASEAAVLALQTATLAVADGAAAAGLAVEQQARLDADGAAASQTASLAATAAGLQAAITTESSVRATDDAAAASQVTALASRVDVGDSSNAAAIQAEQSTRADSDSAQAAQAQALSAAAGDNASAIRTERDARADETQALASQSQTIGAAAGAALAGLVIEQSARADADSAAASQAQQLAARLGESVAGLAAEQAVSVNRDSALATQTTQLVAGIGQAAAGLVEERNVRAAGDVVVADQVTGLAARLGDGSAGIQEERLARVAADEAAARQVLTIAADLGTNAAGIQAEQQARTTADASVAGQLTLLVSKTDNTAAALQTETLTRATETGAIAAAATRLATQFASGALLPFDFSTGKADWTNATGGSPSAVAQPSGTVIANDPDLGACLEITDFDSVGEALLTRQVLPATQGKVYRIVTRLKIVSSDGSVQMGHLAAGLLGDYSLVGTSNLGTTTISGAALGDGSLNGAGAGNVTLTGAGVFTISSMASSSSGAQFGAWPAGSAWVRLGVRLGTAEAGLVVRVGSIRIEEVTTAAGLAMESFTRSTQDEAISGQITTLSANFASNNALVQSQLVALATADQVFAGQLTTLTANYQTADAALQASLTNEQTARSNADSALSTSISTLSAQVNNASTGLPATRALLLTDYYTRAGADSAIASATTTLQSSINNTLTGYATTASLSTEAVTRANADNTLFAKYTVKIDNAGQVSGFGLASEANNASPTSAFGIRADAFWIAGPSFSGPNPPTANLYPGMPWYNTSDGKTYYLVGYVPGVTETWAARSTDNDGAIAQATSPFIVRTTPATINGQSVPAGVYLRDAFIQNGTITNAKIANLAVDNAKIANLDASKINVGFLSADRIQVGSLDAKIATITNAQIQNLDASKINAGTINAVKITAGGGVQLGQDVVSGGHYGLSLSGDNFNNIFLRRSDGVVFFRLNEGGSQSLTFDSASGNLNIRGQINGGSYTGYAWPAINNFGFHLGPSGLLLGNANNNRYFQVTSDGQVYAPNLTIVNGDLSLGGGKFVAQSNGTVYADTVDIRRRIVLQNGAHDTQEMVYGYYADGENTFSIPAGTTFPVVTCVARILTDIYDANTMSFSSNQPYYVAARAAGAFRNYQGQSATFNIAAFGDVAPMRSFSNTGSFPDDNRLAITLRFQITLISGSFTQFRMPWIEWILFKL